MRPSEGNEDEEIPVLRAEILKALLDFIAQRSQGEQANSQVEKEVRGARTNAMIAAVAASFAAIMAFIAVLLSRP